MIRGSGMLSDAHIQEENAKRLDAIDEDVRSLTRQLARRGVDAEGLVRKAMDFRVAVPSVPICEQAY